MNIIRSWMNRIIRNKKKKGFPLGNFTFDFRRLREEVNEFEESITGDNFGEEAADIIIFTLGIVAQIDPNWDMKKSILDKMDINEKRKIIKISDEQFIKVEGSD